ncbi:unnamed protein product [Linum tenue]|uniref:Uncharacterized protein n=1 Tax=Linum tenue TaxID=586396 RepID=A0AAV0JCD4_9ROSI|nr:unnamed protein product [Linum tenue]
MTSGGGVLVSAANWRQECSILGAFFLSSGVDNNSRLASHFCDGMVLNHRFQGSKLMHSDCSTKCPTRALLRDLGNFFLPFVSFDCSSSRYIRFGALPFQIGTGDIEHEEV